MTKVTVGGGSHVNLRGTIRQGIIDIISGSNITIDKTDPLNPIINSSGGGGSSYTFSNGLTEIGGAVKLDGELVDPSSTIEMNNDGVDNKTFTIKSNYDDGTDYEANPYLEFSAGVNAFGVRSTSDASEVAIKGQQNGVNDFSLKITDTRATPTGLEYESDISSTFGNLSVINKGFADGRFWSKTGSLNMSGNYGFTTGTNFYTGLIPTLDASSFSLATSGNTKSAQLQSTATIGLGNAGLIRTETDVVTNVSSVYMHTGTSASTNRKGFIITSNVNGINVIDNNGGNGLFYNADYSVNGIANLGDRFIPDWGKVNSSFWKTTGNTTLTGTASIIGNQYLQLGTTGSKLAALESVTSGYTQFDVYSGANANSLLINNVGFNVSLNIPSSKFRLTYPSGDAAGQLGIFDASGYMDKLSPGTNGHVLTLSAGVPTWAAPFAFPIMTTTQKNAITPVEGMVVYDTTLHQISYYNGTSWINL